MDDIVLRKIKVFQTIELAQARDSANLIIGQIEFFKVKAF